MALLKVKHKSEHHSVWRGWFRTCFPPSFEVTSQSSAGGAEAHDSSLYPQLHHNYRKPAESKFFFFRYSEIVQSVY